MPELPDVTVYREALEAALTGARLEAVRLATPFVLRTAVPPIDDAIGRRVVGVRRIGKRLVLELNGGCFLVLHLMIAGRLLWRPAAGPARARPAVVQPPKPRPVRNVIATFVFDRGALSFTEAGSRKRAALHVVLGETALAAMDPGGIDPIGADLAAFAARLRAENHTIKRTLTDPRQFSGIGNAYSDEILHRARLSPFALTRNLDDAAIARLHRATADVLREWTGRLRADLGATPFGFPEQVTAFRPEMAVHGRFGQPCPVCGKPVQRIVYADNETNYCARCQTGDVVLADRSLSRLLKASWPKSIDELG